MKKISEHLGQIIVALAGVALLVAAVVVFKAPIGEFYNTVLSKETSITDTVLEGMDDIDLGALSNGPVMLDGANAVFVDGVGAPLSFRSSAPMSEFREVKVDGAPVDPANYTVTEGSTIVTFSEEYTATLASGEHAIEIVSTSGSATTRFRALTEGTIYKHGDYIYTFNVDRVDGTDTGWEVTLNTEVTDRKQTVYDPILESIDGQPIVSLPETFSGCTNLTVAPAIPSGVKLLYSTFSGCTNLTTAPTLPSSAYFISGLFYYCPSLNTYEGAPQGTAAGDFSGYVLPANAKYMAETFALCDNLVVPPAIPAGVIDLNSAFRDCDKLASMPAIPAGVQTMGATFEHCISLGNANGVVIPESVGTLFNTFQNCPNLTGTIEINANITFGDGCFQTFTATSKPIVLTGTSAYLEELAATATNNNVTVQ